jgi:hypothetical protein
MNKSIFCVLCIKCPLITLNNLLVFTLIHAHVNTALPHNTIQYQCNLIILRKEVEKVVKQKEETLAKASPAKASLVEPGLEDIIKNYYKIYYKIKIIIF